MGEDEPLSIYIEINIRCYQTPLVVSGNKKRGEKKKKKKKIEEDYCERFLLLVLTFSLLSSSCFNVLLLPETIN